MNFYLNYYREEMNTEGDTEPIGIILGAYQDKRVMHYALQNITNQVFVLKNDLIYILLEKDRQKQTELFQQIYNEISENIVPVRPGRHYKRTKGQLAGNYSNTHKRSY